MGNCLKYNKSTIKDNIIHHKLYFYDKPETLNISYTTINGKLEGEYLLFNKEGKLMTKSFYKNGELSGIKTDYNIYMQVEQSLVKVKKYEQLYENGIEISTNIIN